MELWDAHFGGELKKVLGNIGDLTPGAVLDNPSQLHSYINTALAPETPVASPPKIYSAADACEEMAKAGERAFGDLHKIIATKLPAVWNSSAKDTAELSFQNAVVPLQNAVAAFNAAAAELRVWGDTLRGVQLSDPHDRYLLTRAAGLSVQAVMENALMADAGPFSPQALQHAHDALILAVKGCSGRLASAQKLASGGRNFFETLGAMGQYAPDNNLLPVFKDITVNGYPHVSGRGRGFARLIGADLLGARNPDGSAILTRQDYQEFGSSGRWDRMSQAQRRTFEDLLGSCPTPQAAAYAYRQVAHGVPPETIKTYYDSAEVRQNLHDPRWMQQNLSSPPVVIP